MSMQCQRRHQISRVKNIDSGYELSAVAFRLPNLMGGFLSTVDCSSFVHHKVSGSNISTTVYIESPHFPITMNIRTGSVYNLIGYDITSYFRSEVSHRDKIVENVASDGFGSNFSRTLLARITEFYTYRGQSASQT